MGFNRQWVQISFHKIGGNVVFGDSFSNAVTELLIQVSKCMKIVDYLTLLNSKVLPHFKFLKEKKSFMDPRFQDDIWTVLWVKNAHNWFEELEIDVPHITWSSNSQYLNFIYKIWGCRTVLQNRKKNPTKFALMEESVNHAINIKR